MYARIARFEGGDLAALDEETKRSAATSRPPKRGEPGSEHSEELVKSVSRLLALVDRKSGKGAVIALCDTEEDLRKADRIFDSMTPSPDTVVVGSRSTCTR